MTMYPRTDTAVTAERPCPDCGYDISPGYEHGRIPQPLGGSHVVCALQRVSGLRRSGPCRVCGIDSSELWVPGIGVVQNQHHGPTDGHPAMPGTLAMVDAISRYLNEAGES